MIGALPLRTSVVGLGSTTKDIGIRHWENPVVAPSFLFLEPKKLPAELKLPVEMKLQLQRSLSLLLVVL